MMSTINNYPLVSVFTLMYNTNPKFVIEAIESIRDNNYPNIQHIIIDDCSPDSYPKGEVKKWIDDNDYDCEFYDHEINYGVCKTLNHVLQLAKGKYICGCCDDIFLKDKIMTEVDLLENNSEEFAAVYSDSYLIDENGKELSGLFIEKYRKFETLPHGDIFKILVDDNFLPVPAMMWKTNLLVKAGGYDESLQYEDYDMHLKLFKHYKIILNDKIIAKYRIHNESLSNNGSINWNQSLLKIYIKHRDFSFVRQKIDFYLEREYSGGNKGKCLEFIDNYKYKSENRFLQFLIKHKISEKYYNYYKYFKISVYNKLNF